MPNSAEPDYVNDLPEGCPPDTPRCQYVFHRDDIYKRRIVEGRPCGLSVEPHDADPEPRCYFYSIRIREGDTELKERVEATVASGAYLGEAELAAAQLREAQIPDALLRQANLQGADLSYADLQDADLQDADLRGVQLQGAHLLYVNLQRANLLFANLQAVCLVGANLHGADLSAVKLQGAHSDKEWHDIRTRHGIPHLPGARPTFADCEAVYRQLKLNYQESGDYQTAGEFFVREMECKRAQMVRDQQPAPTFRGRWWGLFFLLPLLQVLGLGWRAAPPDSAWWLLLLPALIPFVLWAWPMRYRALSAAMYLLCGYGERPSWIAAWAAGLVAFFAFIHAGFGLEDGNSVEQVRIAFGWQGWGGLWAAFCQWSTALYFSVVTFTSLGYGDLAPAPVWGRFFAGVEAALGIVIMSLFLICVVRKYSR